MAATALPGMPAAGQAAGGDMLTLWAEATGRRRAAAGHGLGGLRFAFYGRVSTEDWQDPVTSRARQRDQAAAPVVRWMFAQRLAGHSAARITRALNDAGIPCPSAADPKRNPHRTGAAWTLRTVAAILVNPRYTGRQV